jgi:hypothetical protein
MDAPTSAEPSELVSLGFLGRWHRLVSVTNWEKGRIIVEWRQALEELNASPDEYSDTTWSDRVGNVSPGHVSRLRRTFERFGGTYESYRGLYWSHFQAALDWDDAELWLEGAVQNTWTVSEMRATRLEVGRGDTPSDVVTTDLEQDEDFSPPDRGLKKVRPAKPEDGEKQSVDAEELPDDARAALADAIGNSACETPTPDGSFESRPTGRPSVSTVGLPDDIATPAEALKLAIVRHRIGGWQLVEASAVAALLEGLIGLVWSPS